MPIISLLANALYSLENSKYSISPVCIDKIDIEIDAGIVWVYAYNNLYKYNERNNEIKMIRENIDFYNE